MCHSVSRNRFTGELFPGKLRWGFSVLYQFIQFLNIWLKLVNVVLGLVFNFNRASPRNICFTVPNQCSSLYLVSGCLSLEKMGFISKFSESLVYIVFNSPTRFLNCIPLSAKIWFSLPYAMTPSRMIFMMFVPFWFLKYSTATINLEQSSSKAIK